jgi:hypothetical protein
MKDEPPASEPGEEPAGADAAALFAAELADHWREHGKKAFDLALTKDPVRYVTLAAKLICDGPSAHGQTGLIALLAGMGEGE